MIVPIIFTKWLSCIPEDYFIFKKMHFLSLTLDEVGGERNYLCLTESLEKGESLRIFFHGRNT